MATVAGGHGGGGGGGGHTTAVAIAAAALGRGPHPAAIQRTKHAGPVRCHPPQGRAHVTQRVQDAALSRGRLITPMGTRGSALQTWDNPVFETPEVRLPRLAHGGLHRYATYFLPGQTGMENVVSKGYARGFRSSRGCCLGRTKPIPKRLWRRPNLGTGI